MIRAPILVSGSITRRIGRFDNDRSPSMVAVSCWAARIPDMQPDGGSGVDRLEGPLRLQQPPNAAALDFDVCSARWSIADAESAQAARVAWQSAPRE